MINQDLDRKNSFVVCGCMDGLLHVVDAHIHFFSFLLVNILFILERNTPAMPLSDAQIGGFFFMPRA